MRWPSLGLAVLLLASCGRGPPEFDDGKLVGWITTTAASQSANASAAPDIAWSSKPSADQLRAAYPADATGTVAFELRCQVRRDTPQGRCALIGTEPESEPMRVAGRAIAGAFVVDARALKSKSAGPFADVLVTLCKREAAHQAQATDADDCTPTQVVPTDEPAAGQSQDEPAKT